MTNSKTATVLVLLMIFTGLLPGLALGESRLVDLVTTVVQERVARTTDRNEGGVGHGRWWRRGA